MMFGDIYIPPFGSPIAAYKQAIGDRDGSSPADQSEIESYLLELSGRENGLHPYRDADRWVVEVGGFESNGPRRLLTPAMTVDGSIIAVRATPLGTDEEYVFDLQSFLPADHISEYDPHEPDSTQDLLTPFLDDGYAMEHDAPDGFLQLSESEVETDPKEGLAVSDIPIPFSRGALVANAKTEIIVVSRSPVLAAVLNRHSSVRACALVRPAHTLGSAGALQQFVEMGALRLQSPSGTLVVVDAGQSLSKAGAALLKSFFAEVIEAPAWEATSFVEEIARASPRQGRTKLSTSLLRRARMSGKVSTEAAQPIPTDDGAPDTRGTGFVEASAIATSPGESVDWVIPGLAARGNVTDLVGEPKAGKSTLLLEAARALALGNEFLGEPCKPGKTVYVSEQSAASLKATLTQLNWQSVDGVSVLPGEAHADLSLDAVLELVRREVQKVNARLVVLDTFPAVAKVGEEFNSAGAVRKIFAKIQGLLKLDVAVVLSRHTTKAASASSDVSVANAGAGSHAISGSVDHIVLYRLVSDASGPRQVDVLGRLRKGESYYVDWTDSGFRKRAMGRTPDTPAKAPSRREQVAALQERAVVEALGQQNGAAVGVEEIASRIKASGSTRMKDGAVRITLRRLIDQGIVTVDAAGRKHLFSLTPAPRDSPSSPGLRPEDDES